MFGSIVRKREGGCIVKLNMLIINWRGARQDSGEAWGRDASLVWVLANHKWSKLDGSLRLPGASQPWGQPRRNTLSPSARFPNSKHHAITSSSIISTSNSEFHLCHHKSQRCLTTMISCRIRIRRNRSSSPVLRMLFWWI